MASIGCSIAAWAFFWLAATCALPGALPADTLRNEAKPDRSSDLQVITPIGLYQKIISRADGDRCPMYPSCSHYAAEAFAQKGLLAGWILTCDRLLRCGRDETRRAPKVVVNGRVRSHDPLSANVFWWDRP